MLRATHRTRWLRAACLTTTMLFSMPLIAQGHGKIDCTTEGIHGPRCLGGLDIQSLPAETRQNHIFFTGGGAALDENARKQLDALATLFANDMFKTVCVRLVGHTDAIGPSDINLQLSFLRAKAVADYLIEKMGENIPEVSLIGRGENEPLERLPKDSLAHRRVAIEVSPCPVQTAAAQ